MIRRYYCPREFVWVDPKTEKTITVPLGYPSDGATGATDVWSYGWFAHDLLCDRGTWDDGTKCTPRDASRVLKDVLKSEGRWLRARLWGFATWAYTSMPWVKLGEVGERIPIPEKAGMVDLIDPSVYAVVEEKAMAEQ